MSEDEARRLAVDLVAHDRKSEIQTSALVVYQYVHVSNSTGKPSRGPSPRERVLAASAIRQAEAQAAGFTPQPGHYYLAWDVHVLTVAPRGSWRVLIDAASGHLLQVIDLAQYATGSALVFDPNPIVTSGNTSLRHTSPQATINAQRIAVTVQRLNPPVGGNLELHGSHVQIQEEEAPTVAEPTNGSGTFDFSWDLNGFLDAMAYFHLDRFQD